MEHTEQNSVVLSTTGLILPTYIAKLLPIEIFYLFFSPSSPHFFLFPYFSFFPAPHLHSVFKQTGRFVGSIFLCKKEIIFPLCQNALFSPLLYESDFTLCKTLRSVVGPDNPWQNMLEIICTQADVQYQSCVLPKGFTTHAQCNFQ